MALRLGQKALYLWGASSAVAQRHSAPYALQWHTMRWARDAGCATYDLWGAPDDPADKTDPTYGLYYFKRGFGGRHVQWVGAFDRVLSPLLYRLWNAGRPAYLAAMRALR